MRTSMISVGNQGHQRSAISLRRANKKRKKLNDVQRMNLGRSSGGRIKSVRGRTSNGVWNV